MIVTSEEEAATAIMRITEGQGANVLLDAVTGSLLAQIIPGMALRGKIYVYGLLTQEPTILPMMEFLKKNLSISGYIMNYGNDSPTLRKAAKDFIYDGLASGKLKPIIAKTFSFDDFIAAHEYLESNQQVGKIIVTI